MYSGGAGTSTQQSWLGQVETQYDASKALQGKLAQEQWDWQKRLYEQQLANAQQGAGTLGTLVNEYNRAYTEAKQANEQRYQQMLGITEQTTGQRAADIRSDYTRQQSSQLQQLARRGLAAPTITASLKHGTQREQQSALNRLADEMQGTKLGIMERREDTYPTTDIIMALAQALGQGGVGMNLSSLGNMTLG